MKKGFTLLEMVTVIILLGVLGLIVFPAVTDLIKDSKERLYNEQLDKIKTAAEKWSYDNRNLLPSIDGDSITITLLELKKTGYLPLDIRDPRDDQLISNSLCVVITLDKNIYEYTINEVISNTEYDPNGPVLVLNGQPVETTEMGYLYIEKGVVATTISGSPLNDISISYFSNGREVEKVDTHKLETYTINYSVTDNNITNSIARTVIVKDTEAPSIQLPSKVTISQSQAANYDLYAGVVITDNSGEEPNVEITGFSASVGEKIVSYKACDSSNNCDTKNRIIVVE